MYDGAWYGFLPEDQPTQTSPVRSHSASTANLANRPRKGSLLRQNTDTLLVAEEAELKTVEEDPIDDPHGPPLAPKLPRRARSFHATPRPAARRNKAKRRDEATPQSYSQQKAKWTREGLALESSAKLPSTTPPSFSRYLAPEAIPAPLPLSQKYTLYQDQIALAERHLDSLMEDTSSALQLLSSLSQSFKSVLAQTSDFRAQCQDLLADESRLGNLTNGLFADLRYYSYLNTVSRQLNAPSAGRIPSDARFLEMLGDLDWCIDFMSKHPTYVESDTYLARYRSLLMKALHLLEVGFSKKLQIVSSDMAKQATEHKSDALRFALAYGRFEEILLNSHHTLVHNVQYVMSLVYDQDGLRRQSKPGGVDRSGSLPNDTEDLYENTAKSIIQLYLQMRDQDFSFLIQHDLASFRSELESSGSLDPPCRNLVKQFLERCYTENKLFTHIFRLSPRQTSQQQSAFMAMKNATKASATALPHVANISSLTTQLLDSLRDADLDTVCDIVGWMTHEYVLPSTDYDDAASATSGPTLGHQPIPPTPLSATVPAPMTALSTSFPSVQVPFAKGGGTTTTNVATTSTSANFPTLTYAQFCTEVVTMMMVEQIWPFVDRLFTTEVTQAITRSPTLLLPEALRMNPVRGHAEASSNAHPIIRDHVIPLLRSFDQCMPKERCQDSPVLYTMVMESIKALQRAEAKIRESGGVGGSLATDPDVFMVKNLLVLKNELMLLDFDDLRQARAPGGGNAGEGAGGFISSTGSTVGNLLSSSASVMRSMMAGRSRSGTPPILPTVSRLLPTSSSSPPPLPVVPPSSSASLLAGGNRSWDQYRPQRWVSYLSSFIPSRSKSDVGEVEALSRDGSWKPDASVGGRSMDAHDFIDELLRYHIYHFTQHWASRFHAASDSERLNLDKEVDQILRLAFSTQPDIIMKQKEAIELRLEELQNDREVVH